MNLRQIASAALMTAFVAGMPLAAEAADKGKDLFNKNGCVACHGLGAKDTKKMGPNFSEVAAKYKNDAASIDKIAKKIRAGGAGTFGKVPMPPMAQVSEADAKELAKFALAHKGK